MEKELNHYTTFIEVGTDFKSLPLYESQTTLEENDHELVLQCYLKVTYDHIIELMSFGLSM